METYPILPQTQRQRVNDGAMVPVRAGVDGAPYTLGLVLPQLGDVDSLEYAWWVRRGWDDLAAKNVTVRAIGMGNRESGQAFCQFTGFPVDQLWVDPTADLHRQLGLYEGLSLQIPGLAPRQRAWVNLMLMCAGIARPGTFLFDDQQRLIYEHRDRGILDFAENKSDPLMFLAHLPAAIPQPLNPQP